MTVQVVCKICKRELSLKRSDSWKVHYLTHCDSKPHQCQLCSSSFIRADTLRKHMVSKHAAECKHEISDCVKVEWNLIFIINGFTLALNFMF